MHTGSDLRSGRRRLAGRATAAVIIMLVTSCLSVSGARVSGAAEDDAYDDLTAAGLQWYAHSEARGFSPYAEIPSEQPGGGPFARVELDSTLSTPAVAFGAMGYPSEVAQEGAIGLKELPGEVYAANPEGKFPKTARFAPFGDSGPYAQVDAPTRVNGEAISTYRALDQAGVHIDGGYSRTASGYNRDLDAMVSEATTRLSGLDLPSGLHIGNFESWVKLIVPRVGEPKVDYRLALTGVLDGDKSATEWSNRSATYAGNDDLSVSGQGIGIGKVVQDFAAKMNESAKGGPFAGSIFVTKPRVDRQGDTYTVAGAGLDMRSDNGPRKGTLGQATGIRFGDVYARITFH